MAYQLMITSAAEWAGDGCGSMSVPSGQRLKYLTPFSQVPGGDTITAANLATAFAAAAAVAAAYYTTPANLAVIQGWASGLP